MKELPVIEEEKCQGCGLCVDICTCGALVLEGNIVKLREADKCGWCTLCELVCPSGAISCPYEIIIEEDQP